MSQEQEKKSDEAMQTGAPVADVTGMPPVGPKKSPLIAIIAIIVVIALIGTAFMVMMQPTAAEKPTLEIKITPSSVSIANGSQLRITPFVTFKNSSTDQGKNLSTSVSLTITAKWTQGASQLGNIERKKTLEEQPYVLFTAGKVGTSSLNWTFIYTDENLVQYMVYKTTPVVVTIAVLSYIEITPAEKILFKGKSQEFIAVAFLTNMTEVPASFTWYLDDSAVGTLSAVNGSATTLTAGLVNASGNLVCNGTYLSMTVSSKAKVTVITVLPPPSIKTRIYDLMNVPLGDFWQDRTEEQVIRDTFPVAYEWFGSPPGNTWLYSDYRMSVVAKNISTANTSENPWYVPTLSPKVRGGNIEIDWNGTYLTKAQTIADYPASIADWYDSWYWRWNGTVKMDRTAAKMVLNMTDVDYDDFATWKANKFGAFKQELSNWIMDQMNVVWAIKFYYEFEGNVMVESYDIEKVGNDIILKIIDRLSWGDESLLGRWWRGTFLQFEGWPDDFHFTAQIGPLVSNFTLDMTVQYSLVAQTSTRDGRTSWEFEGLHGDCLPGIYASYSSEFNPYMGKQLWSQAIANSMYKEFRDFDYTPWAWNLSANDTLVIEWPSATSSVMGYDYNGTNNCNKTVSGKLSPLWIEPIPGEIPSNIVIDNTARKLTFKGPLDTWTWSKTTLACRELRDNWSRVGYLPHGLPWIEFVVNNDVNSKPIAAIGVPKLWGLNNPLVVKSASYDIDDTVLTYDWCFGDGSAHSALANPTHTWTVEGNYTIILNVTDGHALKSNDTTIIQIVFNMPTVPVLTGSIYGNIQEPMMFNADDSYDLDTMDNSTIISYDWDFGDGNTTTTTGSRTSHKYSQMGMYNVTLTTSDGVSAPQSVVRLYVITTDLCAKIAMPRCANVGDNVLLKGNRSFTFSAPEGRTLANWTWDFGDGTKAYTQNVTHAWSSAGIFTVNLFVKDSIGLQSQNATAKIVIATAAVSGLGLSLARHSLFPGESTTLTIKAVNDAGKVVTSFTGNVDLKAWNLTIVANGSALPPTPASGCWTLPTPVNFAVGNQGVKTVTVSCATPGSYNISAAVQGTPSQNGSIFATVNNRTVEIKVYDIFVPGLPDYWLKRCQEYFGGDEGFRNYTPSVEIFRVDSAKLSAAQLFTMDVVSIEARNVPEYNMSSPTFTALRNPTTGRGNATVALDFHYMTQAEVLFIDGKYTPPGYTIGNWDGWEYFLTCNVTMDREAAEQIIGLPLPTTAWWTDSTQTTTYFLDNPVNLSNWWDVDSGEGMWLPGNFTVYDYWDNVYLGGEGGVGVITGRLDVKSSEDYYNFGQGLWNNSCMRLVYLDADHVSLSYWNIGYGYDVLLGRWLYWGGPGNGWNYPNGTPNGIMPYEPWYDNMSLRVDIHENCANVSMCAVMAYDWRAWTSEVAPAGTATWIWSPFLTDYLPSPVGGLSELDIYVPYRNESDPRWTLVDPGSSNYGEASTYDAPPVAVTLEPGESLIILAPRTLTVGYLPMAMIGDETDPSSFVGGYYDFLKVLEVFGNATIHPVGCWPDTYSLDKEMGDLTMIGPFVPIIEYHPQITWLVYMPAPRIELWIQ